MKKYNLFCLKIDSIQPNSVEITEPFYDVPKSRRDLFDSFFQVHLPTIDNIFSCHSHELLVSIDRGFYSPFNMSLNFRQYAFHLGYLKKLYSYLADKIVVSRVQVNFNDSCFIYIFFVKEVQ